MKLFIYNVNTSEIVETISGETNEDCERLAAEANWDENLYGWTYTNNGQLWAIAVAF